MYKVFINNSPVLFSTARNEKTIGVVVPFSDISTSVYSYILSNLTAEGMTILAVDAITVWDNFIAQFQLVEAAGGVVKNDKNDILFIYRNDKWDLPKGKIEAGEKTDEAAIREVEEECGIGNLKIIKKLPTTYHIYNLKGKAVLKPTYWFEMSTDWDKKLIPQLEEGITKVEWIAKEDCTKVLDNTFNSIKEFIVSAIF